MRVPIPALLLLGSLAALALVPGASASACTTTDACVGACVLASAQCDNSGDTGNNLCVFDALPEATLCVPYRDCPPRFGCHPYYGIGAEAYCDLTIPECILRPTL
jgi:hypothetical protein